MINKKYLFLFLAVLTLSLSALFLFETKTVSAEEYETYNVVFRLTYDQQQLGITWADGTTSDKYGYFNEWDGFYEIVNGQMTRTNLVPNRSFNPDSGTNNNYATVNFMYNGLSTLYILTSLGQTAWFLDLDLSYLDSGRAFIVQYEFIEDRVGGEFTYKTSATTTETVYDRYISRVWTLAEQFNYFGEWDSGFLNPPSYGNEIFSGWYVNGLLLQYSDLMYYYPTEYIVCVARYVPDYTVYTVSFYDGLTLIDTKTFVGGIGSIVPGLYNFGVGQSLLGWSLSLGGSILNLSSFNLTEDVSLYAVKTFNSDSSIGGGQFDIPYQVCSTFDIPCHLGNAVVYFLNEFPLISDVANFLFPVKDLMDEFIDQFAIFEGLGWFFSISLGVLLISFIFRFLK